MKKFISMKSSKILKILWLVLSVVWISACTKGDDILPLNLKVDLGKFYLLSESVEQLPYLGMTKATYEDSSGNEVVLIIEEYELKCDQAGYTKFDVHTLNDTVHYTFETEIKTFLIHNDSLELVFRFSLSADPYFPDPESGAVADVISIGWWNPNPKPSYELLVHEVNTRSYPKSSNLPILKEKEIIGKVFEDVIMSQYFQSVSKICFNLEFGLLSFTDRQGKLWRLKEVN